MLVLFVTPPDMNLFSTRRQKRNDTLGLTDLLVYYIDRNKTGSCLYIAIRMQIYKKQGQEIKTLNFPS